MRARVVYSLLFVTVLVVFSESFCFASSTTTKNTAVSQALLRGRRRYLLEEKPTESDARIHLHRSLFIPPKEGEEEKEKGEKETQKSENEWRGAETKTLANLLELEQKYGKMMSDFREQKGGGMSLADLDRIGDEYRAASRAHHEELERAKSMLGKEGGDRDSGDDRRSDDSDESTIPRTDGGIDNNENIDVNDRATRERFFKARARKEDDELIVFAVGDTRDHRRVTKDPAIATISTDFVANVALNLKAMGIEHYVVVASSKELCETLKTRYAEVFGEYGSCGFSTAYTENAQQLEKWNLKVGDMFLLWMQQWLFVSQAMEYGYSVMRVDSDVVFLEDPYKIINGPLMSPFRVISQTDLFAANTRPKCDRKVDKATLTEERKRYSAALGNDIVLCDDAVPNALLNIGLIYFRKSTLTPHKETALYDFFVKLNGKFQSILEDQNADGNAERLLDQPIFRDVMNQFFVGSFKVATAGDGMTSMYQHNACPHDDANECEIIQKERKVTALSFVEISKQPRNLGDAIVPELVLGAPDWFFGRGCLRGVADGTKTVRSIRDMMTKANLDKSEYPIGKDTCPANPRAGTSMRAPGKAARGGGLVAVHAVYSKAKKRVDAMRALGWWRLDEDSTTTQKDDDACENNSGNANGILFTHTYFRQNDIGYKAFVCAGKPKAVGQCACCSGVPEITLEKELKFIEYATDDQIRPVGNTEKLQRVAHGCGALDDFNGGWNEFWN